MASANNQYVITLPVSDLKGMTDFYASALKPLGYGITGNVSRAPRGYAASQEVELGPAGTGVVDLRLSQSDKPRSRARRPSSAAIVFPAASAVAVDRFYNAALRARGSDYLRPEVRYDGQRPLYAATVSDIEGNVVEVQTEDIPQQYNRSHDMMQYQPERGVQRARSSSYSATRPPIYEEPAPRTAPSSPGSRNQQPTDSNESYFPSKTMVGTLMGAAAGVALAYAAITSHSDSVDKEREYKRRVDERKQVKAEAWENTYGAEKQSYGRIEAPLPIRSKEDSYRISPDSGYASGSPPDRVVSPRGPPSRSFTFPPTRPVSTRRRSETSSERTIRGIDVQPSTAKPFRPSKPTPPSPPLTRESRTARRASYDGSAARSSANGSTKAASKVPTSSSKNTVRSYRSAKDVPLPESRQESAYTSRTYKSAKDIPLPESRQESTYTSRSQRTAKDFPLPEYRQESAYTSRSDRTARNIPLPATREGSRYTEVDESDDDTVLPEDSISQVSSRPKSSRKSTASSRRSKR